MFYSGNKVQLGALHTRHSELTLEMEYKI